VQRLLRRWGLGCRGERLAVLERRTARTSGLLTERTRRHLARARHQQHVHAEQPGKLVSLNTFYIGKLKGVGKVWQIAACDAASSTEFRAEFAASCQALGIRHTRTKPRHAWTKGFVERLQGTILHEYWRIEFRRQYFTSRAAMQRTLDNFMRFHNEDRPHQGHRLRPRSGGTLPKRHSGRELNSYPLWDSKSANTIPTSDTLFGLLILRMRTLHPTELHPGSLSSLAVDSNPITDHQALLGRDRQPFGCQQVPSGPGFQAQWLRRFATRDDHVEEMRNPHRLELGQGGVIAHDCGLASSPTKLRDPSNQAPAA
jgi:hypothetical protein